MHPLPLEAAGNEEAAGAQQQEEMHLAHGSRAEAVSQQSSKDCTLAQVLLNIHQLGGKFDGSTIPPHLHAEKTKVRHALEAV